MNGFNLRLQQRRTELGISQAKLAKRVGMSQSGIALLETGRNQETTKIIEIAKALQTTPEWLLNGANSGANANSSSIQVIKNAEEYDFITSQNSPIGIKKSYLDKMGWDEVLIDFFMQDDDSMSSTIYNGDWVLIDKHSTSLEENKMFLIQRDSKKIIRRIAINKDNSFIYRCDNLDKTRFSDSHTLSNDLVIGKVVWVAGKRT